MEELIGKTIEIDDREWTVTYAEFGLVEAMLGQDVRHLTNAEVDALGIAVAGVIDR